MSECLGPCCTALGQEVAGGGGWGGGGGGGGGRFPPSNSCPALDRNFLLLSRATETTHLCWAFLLATATPPQTWNMLGFLDPGSHNLFCLCTIFLVKNAYILLLKHSQCTTFFSCPEQLYTCMLYMLVGWSVHPSVCLSVCHKTC